MRQFRVWHVIVGMLLLALLTACGAEPAPEPQTDGGGGLSPESVTQSFFEDFALALRDPNLRQEERRAYWVDRLAAYFAPNERDDQRLALSQSLAAFVTDLAQLEDNEAVVFELQGFDQIEKVADDGQTAIIRMPTANIYMALTRTIDREPRVFYEQTISLGQLTGRTDGSVPLVNIDGRWYLTEG